MKRFVQTVIVLLALQIMFPLVTIQAKVVTVDGMKYVIFKGHAVLAECLKEDVRDLVIPETVSIDSVTYPITSIGGIIAFGHNSSDFMASPFVHCTNLVSVKVPNSVTCIGVKCFVNCDNLTTVELPNSVTLSWNCFFGCKKLQKIIIPPEAVVDFRAPFYDCHIDTVEFSSGRDSIDGAQYFEECTVGTIIVPSTIRWIHWHWLHRMQDLGNLFIPCITPPVFDLNKPIYRYNTTPWEDMYWGVRDANIIVPDEAVEAYRSDWSWKHFEHIYSYTDLITSMSHLQTDPPSQQSLPQGLYDLSGRRLSVPSTSSVLPKGVYIENGKKRVRIR